MLTSVLARPARGAALAASAGALALGVAACGGDDGAGSANPASAVPASAPLYVEAVLRPEGDLKSDAESALGKITGSDDPAAEIERLLNEGDGDLTWQDDIEPWLGERAGLFFTSFSGDDADGAAVIEQTDEDAARAALEKGSEGDESRTYEDVEYFYDAEDDSVQGVVEGYVVAGTERGFRTVVDTLQGDDVETIADSDQYNEALDAVGEDGALATAYVSTEGLLDAMARSGGIPQQQLDSVREQLVENGGDASIAKLGVTADAITVDAAALGVPEGEDAGGDAAAAVAAVPGDAWLAFGFGAVGERLRGGLQQLSELGGAAGADPEQILEQLQQQTGIDVEQDLLSWMGDGALFAQGTGIANLGGALVVQTSDPQTTNEAIVKITELVRQTSPGTEVRALDDVAGADEGVAIRTPDSPVEIILAVGGEKFVAGVGRPAVEAAIDPQSTLADSESFGRVTDTLGDDVEPTFFFDVAPVLQLVQGLGAGSDDPQVAEAQKYLSRFGAAAGGSASDGDTQRGKLVITLQD